MRFRIISLWGLAVLFVVALGESPADSAKSAWSDGQYGKYDYRNFAKYPPANERLDFSKIDYALLNAAVFYETNRQRKLNDRNVFAHSPALEKAAQGHSKDMAIKNFFSHSSPISGKQTMSKRLALVGVENAHAAENISYTFGIEYEAGRSVYSPEQNGGYFSYKYKGKPILNHTYLGLAKTVVNNWMHSPGHRANILNANLNYLGAGGYHYIDKSGLQMDRFRFTQNFASIKGPAK